MSEFQLLDTLLRWENGELALEGREKIDFVQWLRGHIQGINDDRNGEVKDAEDAMHDALNENELIEKQNEDLLKEITKLKEEMEDLKVVQKEL